MSLMWKDFELNDLNTAKPWAPRETQKDKDVIDTMVGDAITVGKDVSGHKHNKIYSPIGVAGIEIGAAGDAQILNLTVAGIVTNQATGSLETVAVLPISLGGTNSVSPLNNGRVMVSNGGQIVVSPITVAELELLNDMTSVQDGASPSTVFVTKSYVDELFEAMDTFTELTDTPADYSGSGGKLVAVNGGATDLEFIIPSDVISAGTSISWATNTLNVANSNWDDAYTHSQIAGGNSVHVSTTENTEWDAAYTHSTAVTGNPHAVAYSQLGGNPSDRITAGTNISWDGDTLNVIGGGSTFLGLTDTPGSFTANRILFESSSAVTHSDLITWDNANEILQIQNTDVSTASSTFRFRKSRNGGNIDPGDGVGSIVWEAFVGGSWQQQGSIVVNDVAAPSSPAMDMYIGTTRFQRVYGNIDLYPDNGHSMFIYPNDGGVGFRTPNPLRVAGLDITSDYSGVMVEGGDKRGILTIKGTGETANGSYEGDRSSQLVLEMSNTPEAEHSIIAVEINYGGDIVQFRGLDNEYIRHAPALSINLQAQSIYLGSSGQQIDEFSTDVTLGGSSNTALPTEHAVKTYVDGLMGVWTDYSASTVLTGWAASPTPSVSVKYKRVGDLVFVAFWIEGVSSLNTAQFTVPLISDIYQYSFTCLGMNNNTDIVGGASGAINFSSNTKVDLAPSQGYGFPLTAWTASGAKRVRGQFWYKAG